MAVHVYGAVNTKGKPLIEGSGDWTSKRVGTGHYEITFSPPFRSQPVVVASGYIPRPQGGAASDNVFCVGPISEDGVVVRTFDVVSRGHDDNAGQAQDSEFTFIAIANR